MFKTLYMRFQLVSGRRQVLYGRTTCRACSHHQSLMIAGPTVARLVVQLVVPPDNWWCHLWDDLTIGSATSHDLSRLVARPYDWWYHLSLAARDRYTWSASGDSGLIHLKHTQLSTKLHLKKAQQCSVKCSVIHHSSRWSSPCRTRLL